MSIIVEVNKDDIRKGVRKDACSCPIALALRRAIVSEIQEETGNQEPDIEIEVDYGDIRFWNHEISDIEFDLFPVDDEDWYGIKNFIDNFDSGNDVKPFNVELKYN